MATATSTWRLPSYWPAISRSCSVPPTGVPSVGRRWGSGLVRQPSSPATSTVTSSKKSAASDTYTLSLHDALPICRATSTCLSEWSWICDLESPPDIFLDRKSTRLNSSHRTISYAVFCLKKKSRGRFKWRRLPRPGDSPVIGQRYRGLARFPQRAFPASVAAGGRVWSGSLRHRRLQQLLLPRSRQRPTPTLFPYTTLFRSAGQRPHAFPNGLGSAIWKARRIFS